MAIAMIPISNTFACRMLARVLPRAAIDMFLLLSRPLSSFAPCRLRGCLLGGHLLSSGLVSGSLVGSSFLRGSFALSFCCRLALCFFCCLAFRGGVTSGAIGGFIGPLALRHLPHCLRPAFRGRVTSGAIGGFIGHLTVRHLPHRLRLAFALPLLGDLAVGFGLLTGGSLCCLLLGLF